MPRWERRRRRWRPLRRRIELGEDSSPDYWAVETATRQPSSSHRFHLRPASTWPLLGIYTEAKSSLRLAIPDYVFEDELRPGITTGIQ